MVGQAAVREQVVVQHQVLALLGKEIQVVQVPVVEEQVLVLVAVVPERPDIAVHQAVAQLQVLLQHRAKVEMD
jgi:hypothetical protein